MELIYLAVTLMPGNKFYRRVSRRRRQLIRFNTKYRKGSTPGLLPPP